jgi:hypothetical protein
MEVEEEEEIKMRKKIVIDDDDDDVDYSGDDPLRWGECPWSDDE